VYVLLTSFIPVEYAKTISYVAGMIFGFFCNRFFTFRSTTAMTRDALYFLGLYVTSLGFNVAINSVVLFVLPQYVTFAFMCATSVSIVTNYLGQKFFIYKK
jgi:putative flippase GtrA